MPAFQERRRRREDGSSTISSYRMFWRGCLWQPLLAPAANLQRSAASGAAEDVASVQAEGPGVYELSLTCKQSPDKRIKVYCSAASSLRSDAVALVTDGGALRGFLDHALKEGHAIWYRCKATKDPEAAADATDKLLTAFDYAWLQQPGGRARSLVVRQRYLCCSFIKTGVDVKDGPPKFVQPKSGGIMSMLTGGRRSNR